MISTLYLQAEIGAAIIAAFFVAIVISIIFYVIQRRAIKDQALEKLTGKMLQTVPRREEITNLQKAYRFAFKNPKNKTKAKNKKY